MRVRNWTTDTAGRRGVSLALVAMLASAPPLLSAGCKTDTNNDEVLPGLSAMLFAKRAFIEEDGTHNVAGGSGRVVDYLRYTPGGGVFVVSPPTPDGELTELTAEFEDVDVAGLDLSFDATEVVFSMRHAGSGGNYHLYKTGIDGGDVKQLTFGPYDDVRPIFLPGDRIAFVTNQGYTEMGTRADEYNHGRQVTQIATISSASGDADRRVCSQNLSHTTDPFVMSDGSVGFSRWEHLGPVNDLKLFKMNPDCTDMLAVAGQHDKPFNSIVQVRESEPGVMVGIATAREGTIQAGAIMQIDARASSGSAALDEQTASFTSLTPDVPTDREPLLPTGVGRYRSPYMLDDGKLVVSWADRDVSERNELANTAPQFGIYLYDPETEKRVRIYDDPETWDLYGIPVAPREEPPERNSRIDTEVDPSAAGFGAEAAVIGSIDITQTSLDERVEGGDLDGMSLGEALRSAEKVRIIEGFSSEIGGGVREFGLTMHEGAAILGEAEIQPDGSWEAHVVPYLPYHLQPLDRYGLAIRNQMLWIQAMPGENRTCGGCHESRSEAALPTQGATLAQQLPLADKDFSTRPVPDRVELPWAGAISGPNVQDVFDNHCVGCHDGGANDPFAGRSYTVTVPAEEEGETDQEYEIPYLLLTSTPITVEYENDVVNYPASYVTLLYPSAMMGEVTVEGEVPDPWVIPGSARTSPLIQKVNATPEGDDEGSEWAFSSAAHPEDVGGSMTREERLMLIRMADLGGQYYTRRNLEDGSDWYEGSEQP